MEFGHGPRQKIVKHRLAPNLIVNIRRSERVRCRQDQASEVSYRRLCSGVIGLKSRDMKLQFSDKQLQISDAANYGCAKFHFCPRNFSPKLIGYNLKEQLPHPCRRAPLPPPRCSLDHGERRMFGQLKRAIRQTSRHADGQWLRSCAA